MVHPWVGGKGEGVPMHTIMTIRSFYLLATHACQACR